MERHVQITLLQKNTTAAAGAREMNATDLFICAFIRGMPGAYQKGYCKRDTDKPDVELFSAYSYSLKRPVAMLVLQEKFT